MTASMFRLATTLAVLAHHVKALEEGQARVEVGWAAASQIVRMEAKPHFNGPPEASLVEAQSRATRKQERDGVSRIHSKARVTSNATNRDPEGPIDFGWTPCSWETPSKTAMMHCIDGTECDPKESQWTCCALHGGRLRCPQDFPKMCNQRNCGGEDYCCSGHCELFDGDRPCSIKHQIYGQSEGWLTMNTRDEGGCVLSDWTELTAGPMTWEMWYARRPQMESNTADSNAIFSTYADNHNSNTYDNGLDPAAPGTHRRRNVGVYVKPNTGKLVMSSFVGEDPTSPDPLDLGLYDNAAVILSQTNISDYDWHHIAAVWDPAAGTGRLYIDGEADQAAVKYVPGASTQHNNPGNDGRLVIGGGHLGKTTTSQLSQFRIWKKALTADDIDKLVRCGEPELPIGDLKAFYRLSGNMENSAKNSGLPTLQASQKPGLFDNGKPCKVGAMGLKGADALEGAPGKDGEPGPPGEEGDAGTELGPTGPPGISGSNGPPGNPAPQVDAGLMGPATMSDLMKFGGAACAISLVGIALMFSTAKSAKGKGGDGAEAWGGEGGEEW